MLVFQTSQTIKAVHASQVPADYAGTAIDDAWRVARGDTGDAVVFEVRPLSSLEWAQVRSMDSDAQSDAILSLALVKPGSDALSWGAKHAVASLIVAVTQGPLVYRQPPAS